MSTSGGTRAVVAALVANLGIAASKLAVFAFTGSASMLSEGIHSIADSGNQVLLLVGGRHAKRDASDEHQFGYGRVRYVYSFIVAIVLFVVGGLFSLVEGVHKVQAPEELHSPLLAFGVLAVAVVLEGFSLRTALREVSLVRGNRSLWQFVRAARQPELPVIVLEDIGALLGLMFAATGVGIATLTGDPRWDGIGAIAVGALLMVIAVILSLETTSMLVGESALAEDQAAISQSLAAAAVTHRLIHVRTMYVGPDELLVAAKIAVDPVLSAEQVSRGIDEAEAAVRQAVPAARYLFIEPDIER